LDVTISVLSLVQSDVLCGHSTHKIFSLCLRERERRRRSTALLSQSIYTERPFPPLVEEGTLLSSSNGVVGGEDTDRKQIAEAYFRKVG
jgi:hypothetical protein